MFSFKRKPKIQSINIGKQSSVISYRQLDQIVHIEVTMVGAWTHLSAGDFYIKKASIKDLLERAYERGFITVDVEDSKVRCIPVQNIVEVTISPLEENWITPE